MARRVFRRKRRRPVEWVRTFVDQPAVAAGSPTTNGEYMAVNYDASSAQILAVSNLVLGDDPYVVNSLTEERKEYVVQRIVGKTHIAATGHKQIDSSWFLGGPVEARLGLFVADCDKNGIIQGLDTWDLFQADSNPVEWMHRENFILGANYNTATTPYAGITGVNQAAWTFDNTNQARAPWGMLDVKVKRRVAQMEKLFVMLAVRGLDTGWNYNAHPTQVVMWVDWRALISWTTSNRR